MSDTLWLAIIAVVSPVLMAFVVSRLARADRRQDWERQDEVAARAANAVEAAGAAMVVTGNKLDVIHGLVNSAMTTQIQLTLEATKRERAALEKAGSTVQEIELVDRRITDLEQTLADRLLPPSERLEGG